jgi:ATP-dependent DNA helicase RecG
MKILSNRGPGRTWSHQRNSEAVDFRAASECFKAVRQIKRRDLEILRLITTAGGKSCPTVGGVLLFGKNRLRQFPDAWIQVGRFGGKDRSIIRDHAELTIFLPHAIEGAIAFTKKHEERRADVSGVRRVDRWSLPLAAIREAIINAVVHADYAQQGAPIRLSIFDDRIEVENPGLLPFGLTIQDIRQGISKLRNRVIGRVFRELGMIEQWGSGIQRMTRACLETGLDEPEFEEIGLHFRVTLYRESRRTSPPDEVEMQIIGALEEHKSLSTKDIAGITDLSARAIRTRMISLIERKVVVEIGSGPRDPKKRYALAKIL